MDAPAKKTALRAINDGLYVVTAKSDNDTHAIVQRTGVAEVVEAGVRDESRTPLLLRSTGMNYGG